jgi:hypothetical protein
MQSAGRMPAGDLWTIPPDRLPGRGWRWLAVGFDIPTLQWMSSQRDQPGTRELAAEIYPTLAAKVRFEAGPLPGEMLQ